MFVAMFARSYAVTVLCGYDKVVAAAIKGVAAIKEVDAAPGAVGGRRRRGRPRGGKAMPREIG